MQRGTWSSPRIPKHTMTSEYLRSSERTYLTWCADTTWRFSDPSHLKFPGLYLYYALQAQDVQHQFHSFANGITRFGLRKSDIELVEIPSPPLKEQQDIAHVLGTLDDKIELNRRMNRTLEEMARAIFQDWFVDFGPTRAKMEGQEPYLPPELWDLFPGRNRGLGTGEIPEGWDVNQWETAYLLKGGCHTKAQDSHQRAYPCTT